MWGLGGMQIIKGGSWGQCWGGGTEEYLGTLGDVGNIGGVGRHPGPLGTAGDTRGTFGIHWGGTWVVPDSTPLCSPRCSICRGQGWGQWGRGPR